MSTRAMVAVCDVLGYSNLVKSCSLTELKDFHQANIIKVMKSAINNFGANVGSPAPKEVFEDGLVGHVIFSDTIILFSLSDDRDGYRNVLNAAYGLVSLPMFTPNYRYRVGISYGEFYHDAKNSIYIGRALVEANDLEKIQQWSGAALTVAAANKFKSQFPENTMLTDYLVPVKQSNRNTHKKHSVINWTTANHKRISEQQGWMYREENNLKVSAYSSMDVEQKILNTEKFHNANCVQCRSVGRNGKRNAC